MKFYDPCAFTCACVRTVYTVNMIRALVHALLHALMHALVLTTPVKTSLYFYFLRAVDVHGPKAERKKICGPNQFRDPYFSLLNNIADCIRSTVVSC